MVRAVSSGSRLYKGERKGPRVSRARPAPRVRPGRGGPPHVEIVVVGREILRGQTPESNAAFLTADLSRRGALVHRVTIVDDRDRAITSAVTEAIERGAGIVVTTGGLGPTEDDRTLAAVADALGVPLAIHPHAKEMVEAAFRRLRERGIVERTGMTRFREKMCAVPVGGEPIENAAGVSPGVIARLPAGASIVCLPGVPAEARAVWEQAVPRLRELAVRLATAARELEAPTPDESVLRPLVDRVHAEYPAVWVKTHSRGFRQKGRGVRVTFEAFAPTQHEADVAVDGAMQRLLSLAGAG